jgi:hypothetical protein
VVLRLVPPARPAEGLAPLAVLRVMAARLGRIRRHTVPFVRVRVDAVGIAELRPEELASALHGVLLIVERNEIDRVTRSRGR